MTTEYVIKPQKDYWYVHKIETDSTYEAIETITTYTVQRVPNHHLFHCDCPAHYRQMGKCKHITMVRAFILNSEAHAKQSDLALTKQLGADCLTVTPQNDLAAATISPQSWRKLRL